MVLWPEKRWKQNNNKKKNLKGEEEEGKKGKEEEEKKENNFKKKNWKKLDHSWITEKWEALISILISRAVQALSVSLEGFQFGAGRCPAGVGHGREISMKMHCAPAERKLVTLQLSLLFQQEKIIFPKE